MGVANPFPLLAKQGFSKILEALRGNFTPGIGVLFGVLTYEGMGYFVITNAGKLTV